jgi:hypothetical protein
MLNKTDQDFYDSNIRKNIEKINAPEVPARVWDRISLQLKAEEAPVARTLNEAIFSYFQVKTLKYAVGFAVVLILSLASFNKVNYNLMCSNVNDYLNEYDSYISSEVSIISEVNI